MLIQERRVESVRPQAHLVTACSVFVPRTSRLRSAIGRVRARRPQRLDAVEGPPGRNQLTLLMFRKVLVRHAGQCRARLFAAPEGSGAVLRDTRLRSAPLVFRWKTAGPGDRMWFHMFDVG